MRFATSYFNPTLYRKNLSRFWPIWVAWLVLWMFILPLNLFNMWNNYGGDQEGLHRFLRNCLNLNSDFHEIGLAFGAIYAVVVALAVFGYLYNHRSAATMHAFPLRRENLFVTNYLSGLTFFLLPSVVVYSLSALVVFTVLPGELSALVLPTLWSGFWMRTAAELFFYSFAVFCAQFTGNAFALPVFYGILNFLVVAMYSLVSMLADRIFYGGWPIVGEPKFVELLTPYYGMYMASQWDRVGWSELWDTTLNVPHIGELELAFEDPMTMVGYAAAGVIFAAAALLVYRRRHIETAGDVVSVKVVRPIFRAGVSVCVGLWGGVLTCEFFGSMNNEPVLAAFVVLWTVVGFFAAEMLLHKSFRVFKKSWKSCAVTTVVMALAIAACYMDVFGVETWVPDPSKVDKVEVYISNTYPLDDGAYFNEGITDPVQMERIVALHTAIVSDYKRNGEGYYGDGTVAVHLTYLVDGKSYRKEYYNVNILRNEIDSPMRTTWMLNNFLNDPENIALAYNLEKAKRSEIVAVGLQDVTNGYGRYEAVETQNGAREIWEAVQYDFAAGNLGVRYLFEDDVRYEQTYRTDLVLRFLVPQQEYDDTKYVVEYEEYQRPASTVAGDYYWNWTMNVTLTPKAERTIAALEKYYDLGDGYYIALHDVVASYK